MEAKFAEGETTEVNEQCTNHVISHQDDFLIKQFFRQLHQTQRLIEVHGPYTTYAGTTVFSRAPIAREQHGSISVKACAMSYAAAQDCTGTAQIQGPAEEDLRIFEELYNTTTMILEQYLEPSRIQHDPFGWLIIGLCSGYIPHTKWHEDSLFLARKTRLKDALLQLPCIRRSRSHSGVPFDGARLAVLTKANREVHICANLLLQQFKNENWRRIRWFHAMAVAEMSLGHLGLTLKATQQQNPERA